MVGSIPETLPSLFVPTSLGHQYLIIPIGLGIALLEYYLFKTLILKFNLPTIGRRDILDDGTEEIESGSTTVGQDEKLAIIVQGLGGVSNIEEIFNCYSRLRLDVYDDKKVDINLLKEYPSSGIVDKKKHIQIIIGIGVEDVRMNLESYVEDLKSGRKVLPDINQIHVDQKNTTQSDKPNGELFAVANGEIIALSDVSDPAFASYAIGNGYGITHHDGQVYSPVDGEIISIFPTKHAICIRTKNKSEILIHMGIDTVELSGEPFEILVKEGQVISQGEKIAIMNQKMILDKKKEDVIIVINLENKEGSLVRKGNSNLVDPVFKY